MTAAEISALVAAAIALMGAAAAWLHSKTTRAMMARQRPNPTGAPNGEPRSTKQR